MLLGDCRQGVETVLWELFERTLGKVFVAGNAVASVFLAGIAFLMAGDVVGRYVFNSPIQGAFEMVGASMAVLGSIGFAFALAQEKHIRVRLLTDKYPAHVQRYMLIVAYVIGLVLNGVLFWLLLLAASRSVAAREYAVGLRYLPVYVPKTIFAFAVLLFCIGFVQRIVTEIRRPR